LCSAIKKLFFARSTEFFHYLIVKIGSELLYFDVFPAGVHSIAEQNNRNVLFRVYPKGGPGKTQVPYTCF
jgi:hypothetical protein